MCNHAVSKRIMKHNARLVSFFNGSHYWGGVLRDEAGHNGKDRKLITHTESRWYTNTLQAIIIRELW